MLLLLGVGVLFFVIHEQKDDLRIIKTLSVVSKTLQKKQKQVEKSYDNLVEGKMLLNYSRQF